MGVWVPWVMGIADVELLTNFTAHKAATLCLSPSVCFRLHSFLLQSENNWTSALESTSAKIMWDVFCSNPLKHLQEVSLSPLKWGGLSVSLHACMSDTFVNLSVSKLLIPVKTISPFLVCQFSWIDHLTSYQAPLADLQVAFMLQKLMAVIHANHFSLCFSRKSLACFQHYF